jgi:hypothetical protein
MKRPSLGHGTARIIQVIWGWVKNKFCKSEGERTGHGKAACWALGLLRVIDEGCSRRVLQAIVEGVVWTGSRATFFCCIAADRVAGFR